MNSITACATESHIPPRSFDSPSFETPMSARSPSIEFSLQALWSTVKSRLASSSAPFTYCSDNTVRNIAFVLAAIVKTPPSPWRVE